MVKEQALKLLNECTLPDECYRTKFIETHISWILLTDNFAFKIKRPVNFSFLDFSTLHKRKFYCEEELRLNRRLASEMYLDVIPINNKMIFEVKNGEEITDYAVKMKRMDNKKEMGNMLENDEINKSHIDKLARKIADFHQKAEIITSPFDAQKFQENYSELGKEKEIIKQQIGDAWSDKIESSINRSTHFLNKFEPIINERVKQGFKRDCHGDLSCHNVFVYDDPVIFDCIEFNNQFRYIDILNEIAFLCTDLDFYDRRDLSDRYYHKYIESINLTDNPNSRKLLDYYKSYRANVRAKVTLLHQKNSKNGFNQSSLTDVKKYIDLMDKYLANAN